MNGKYSLDDIKGNFAIVLYGFLSDFQKVKAFIESNTDLKIRYQRTSLGKLIISEEGK